MVDVDSHRQQFLPLQLHDFFGVLFLHLFKQFEAFEFHLNFFIVFLKNFSVETGVFLIFVDGDSFLHFLRQDIVQAIAYLGLSDEGRDSFQLEFSHP